MSAVPSFHPGHLVMVDIPGTSLDAATAEFLRRHHVRAICLFRRNLGTEAEVRRLTSDLREVMGPHIESLLKLGVSVVLDFPANTIANRAWMRGLFERGEADHRLHFLDVPDDVCRARMHARNRAGGHDFAPTDETFALIARYFVPPGDEEGFNVVRYPISE